jgi:predicted metal-dependent peptidase
MDTTVANKALTKAKIQLMSNPKSVFLSSVCMSLKHEWDSSIPTACTNGIRIAYNPNYFMQLIPAHQVSLVAHEVWHVAFKHMARLMGLNPRKWNAAADYVINLILVSMGYAIPKDWLHDPQFKGLSTEQVYKLIPDPPLSFNMDIAESGMSTEEEKNHLDEILIRAKVQAEMSGTLAGALPGEIQIYLDSLVNPKLPWYRLLRKYFNSLTKSDYTFRKPNRRFFPDYLLPSQQSEALADIAIAVDTSGSVTDDEFLHFVSETASVIRTFKLNNLQFMQFDSNLKSVDTVSNLRALEKLKFTGRGGTNVKPVMDWARENKPHVLIIFTDGHFNWNFSAPLIPVIWVIYNNPNFKPRFGKLITYEM